MAELQRPKKAKSKNTSTLIRNLETLEVVGDELISEQKSQEIEEQPVVEGNEAIVDNQTTIDCLETDTCGNESGELLHSTPEISEVLHDESENILTTNLSDASESQETKEQIETELQDDLIEYTDNETFLNNVEIPNFTEASSHAHERLYPSISLEESVDNNSIVPSAPSVVEQPIEQCPLSMFLEKVAIEQPSALSQTQLRSLYYNNVLDGLNKFEEDFNHLYLDLSSHPLHSLLANYQSALQAYSQEKDRTIDLTKETERLKEQIWTFSKHFDVKPGVCVDGYKVQGHYSYETAQMNEDKLKSLVECLGNLRHQLTTEASIKAFNTLYYKNLIEAFILKLYSKAQLFKNLCPDAPAKVVFQTLSPSIISSINTFKECLSVLFMFIRRPLISPDFIKDVKTWILQLGSSLVRYSRSEDHLFLLAHLLRCPAGVGKWSVGLLQAGLNQLEPPSIDDITEYDFYVYPPFHHAVAMLALIIRPVKSRLEFLSAMRSLSLSPSPVNDEKSSGGAALSKDQDNPWIFVDSEGEEDFEHQEAWHMLQETDVLAFLSQVPLKALFRYLLLIDGDILNSNSSSSDAPQLRSSFQITTTTRCLRILSFIDQLVTLLVTGLHTYTSPKFKRLAQLLNRMIRLCFQFVSDHLEMHLPRLISSCGQSVEDYQALLQLQAQYETVAIFAIHSMLSANSMQDIALPGGSESLQMRRSQRGLWQNLAEFPFKIMSSTGKKKLLSVMVSRADGGVEPSTVQQKCLPDFSPVEEWLASSLSVDESVHFLTALTNVAKDCLSSERDTVDAIVHCLFRLAYLNPLTEDLCRKSGRELLCLVAQCHPHVISYLLLSVKDNLTHIERERTRFEAGIHLFCELPLSLFHPNDGELTLLSNWLLNCPIKSLPNQLSRVILGRLNWGFASSNSAELFLPIEWHRNMAQLIIKAFKKHQAFKHSMWLISEGLNLISSAVWSSANTPQSTSQLEQEFSAWCLNVMVQLKLSVRSRWLPPHGLSEPFDNHFVNLAGDATWNTLMEEARSGANPVANYAALLIGQYGHKLQDGFLNQGVKLLHNLSTTQAQYRLSIEALSQIIPMFGGQESLLLSSNSFIDLLRTLIHADENYYRVTNLLSSRVFPGPVLNMTTMMILFLCEPIEPEITFTVLSMRQFWLRLLLIQPDWYKDRAILHILDRLLALNFRLTTQGEDTGAEEVFRALQSFRQRTITTWETRTGFSSILHVGDYMPSLVASLPDLNETPWVLFYLSWAEMRNEDELGLWFHLQKEIEHQARTRGNDSVSVSEALKVSCRAINFPMGYQEQLLSIYSLARCITTLKPHQATLPLMLQLFFGRYFAVPDPSISAIASSGVHFFSSHSHTSKLKELRLALNTATTYHNNTYMDFLHQPKLPHSLQPGQSQKELANERQAMYHRVMSKILETFILWIDEPRLHMLDLDLKSLPRQYCVDRLRAAKIGYKDKWVDLLDIIQIDEELQTVLTPWKTRNMKKRSGEKYSHLTQSVPVHERLVMLIDRQSDPVDPPVGRDLVAITTDPEYATLLDDRLLVHSLQNEITVIEQQAQQLYDCYQKHREVDIALEHLLPKLYANYSTQMSLDIACHSGYLLPGVMTRLCKGAAHIVIQHDAHRVVEAVSQEVTDNRVEHHQLLIRQLELPKSELIRAALQIHHVTSYLVEAFHAVNEQDDSEKKFGKLRNSGRCLFTSLASHLSNEVKSYLPSRRIIENSLETLGNVFIRCDKGYIESFLQLICDRRDLSLQLVPYFNPVIVPELFVELYQRCSALYHRENEKGLIVSALLQNFSVSDWLQIYKVIAEHNRLISVITASIGKLGKQGKKIPETMGLLTIYLKHLEVLMNHGLTVYFPLVMKALLSTAMQYPDTPDLSFGILVDCLNCDVKSNGELAFSLENIQYLLEKSSQFLGDHRNQLAHSHTDLESGHLFTHWEKHTFHISRILWLLLQAFAMKISRAVRASHINRQTAVVDLWRLIQMSFSCWLEPQKVSPDRDVYRPAWSGHYAHEAEYFLKAAICITEFSHNSFYEIFQPQSPILDYFWLWFQSSLTPPGLPLPIFQQLTSHFSVLPFHQWAPSKEILNSLFLFYNQQSKEEHFSFLLNILSPVDWLSIFSTLYSYEFGYLDTLFKLAIGLLSRPEILQQSKHAELLIDHLLTLPWYSLSESEFRLACDWLVTRAQPEIVLMQRTSAAGKLVELLSTASTTKMLSESAVHLDENSLSKQVTFVHVMMKLLAQCTMRPTVKSEQIVTRLCNTLSMVESVINLGGFHHSINLGRECLNLLSNTSSAGHKLLLTTLLQWMTSQYNSSTAGAFLLAILGSACRYPPTAHVGALIIETAAQTFMSMDCIVGTEAEWNLMMNYVCLDSTNPARSDIIKESVDSGRHLLLYLIARCDKSKQLSSWTASDHKNFTRQTRDWLTSVPIREGEEVRCLLLWDICLCSVVEEPFVSDTVNPTATICHLNALITFWTTLAEDRTSSGIWGRVGLGRRSPFPVKFRLLSRILSVFCSAQIASGSTLRLSANAPGHVERSMSVKSRPPGVTLPTNQTLQALHQLEMLKQQSQYRPLSDDIEFGLQFVCTKSHCLLQLPQLYQHLLQRLFAEEQLLLVLRPSESREIGFHP